MRPDRTVPTWSVADARRGACRRCWWWVLSVALLVSGAALPAQKAANGRPELRLSEMQKRNWQVEQGLPENNVRMLLQQPNGMLLVATSAGLSSFDGERFEPLQGPGLRGLVNEAVNAVAYGGGSAGQELWVGTDGRGVLRVTPAGVTEISEAAGQHGERVRMLRVDAAGALWIATQNGVERYVDGRMAVVRRGGIIGDLTQPFAEDGRGGMFFLMSAGLFHWSGDGRGSERVDLPQGAGAPTAIYREQVGGRETGPVWVGTAAAAGTGTAGVWRLDPEPTTTGEWRAEAVARGVRSQVTAMIRDGEGALWIGTQQDGIWRQSGAGLEHWGTRDGFPDDTIRTLFLDDENDLWIGMQTGGLSRWRKGAFAPFGAPEGFVSGYAASPFADSRGDLWLATWGHGLFRRRGGQTERMTLPGMPETGQIRAIAEDRAGRIWVGTWFHGVYCWDGRRFTHYLLGTESPGNAVSALVADRTGGLWVGTYLGVVYFAGGEPKAGEGRALLGDRLITSMREDADGSMLVGTGDGLFRVRSGRVEEVGGLPRRYVVSLGGDGVGGVWASTRAGGLAAVHGNQATPLPTGSGVPAVPITTMLPDGAGNLWLGTGHGIARLRVAELQRVAAGEQQQLASVMLGKADGMRSSECAGPSRPLSTRMPDGTLWFATTDGFARTTDLAAKAGAAAPTAAIRGWFLGNDANATELQTGSRVDLRAGEPDLLLFFWAKQLKNPGQVEFRYRMAGYDRDWTLTQARVARYRRLPPGSYRFEVQARNSSGAWSEQVATTAIRQRPHFYETWMFGVLLLLLLLLAVWVYLRRRIQQEKGSLGIVLEERNRIARECHDTLMAGFAAVSWQLEATAKLFRESGTTPAAATESFELARSMVALCQAEARRIIWDLRDAEEVTSSLSKALARMLDVNHVHERTRTSLEVVGEEIALAPGCVHHLMCIGQEAVSNALRHAKPTHVDLVLRYDDEAVQLAIQDDGCGFQSGEAGADSSRGHFGIPVMEERARKLGGTLRLETSVGYGTEVRVTVPFDALERPAMPEQQNVVRWIGL